MTKSLAFILMVSLAACRGEAEVRYSGEATAPELVAMDTDPSVMVVVNSDEPIFYFENTYWLYREGRWLRSSSHRSGWKHIDTPPERITRIDRPLAYVHFRASGAERTTLNQRDQPAPPPDLDRAQERAQPLDQPPADPMREPNSQGPNQPMPNPPPPQQVPPSPDRDPTLRAPSSTRPMPPDQVPPATPERDRPSHQLVPDPDRAPTSPGRTDDQRPASDRRDPAKTEPDPAEAERNKKKDKRPIP
jgi:hypothetical protein